MHSIPGVPGQDYPVLSEIPETGFTCDGRVSGGICLILSQIQLNLEFKILDFYTNLLKYNTYPERMLLVVSIRLIFFLYWK